ncbi:pyridoxal phosphate-dependent decarboxylase family protein [Streptacidiphilus jiangxiensis]|uniref:Glutamate or tyrosine decarboxylase n=1 Tax=Streptacidiphilus jiangxiensis TaxID=235985 RepID=A0A1H7U2F3_STRJI|nr:pyridoxal-dependent decarboxylase [Streptacidiphilus jiangxiensis]SEL90955.1 Glutamate or tyrosine decarboxylase [Streptacidiphilus jiangxiensis]
MTSDFRGAAHGVADMLADYLDGLPDGTVWAPMPSDARTGLLTRPLPEEGADLGDLVAAIGAELLPYPMGNGHPRFFGWVNAAPAPAGILGAFAAAAMNPSSAGGDHADVHLERTVVRWLAELVGFPHPPGGGLLTSGGSMATIVALAAARNRAAAGLGVNVREDGLAALPPLVGYVSTETHSCVRKAAELLGLGSRHLVTVPGDGAGRLDPLALRERIRADRAAGLVPFLVAGSAGTVNAGVVDDLGALSDVCAEEKLWLHVDGAYGAFGRLDPEAAPRYAGLERADSLALDPHKWLGVPVDCGCLLVRDAEQLRGTFSLVPPYLRDDAAGGLGWFSEYGIEQTRPFRSLKVWATLAAAGRAGVVRDVSRCCGLARELGRMVAQAADLELLSPVETSIVAFRWAPADADEETRHRVNAALGVAVQERGRAFVTGTVLGGREAVRACLLNATTTEDDLRVLLDEVRAAAAGLR